MTWAASKAWWCRKNSSRAAAGLGLFHFHQQMGAAPGQFQDLFQGGDGLALAGVQFLQFRQGEVLHQTVAVGGAVQGLVVDHRQAAIPGELDVQFYRRHPQTPGRAGKSAGCFPAPSAEPPGARRC